MESKNDLVKRYVLNIADNLSKQGIEITDIELDSFMREFLDSDLSVEELYFRINTKVDDVLTRIKMPQQIKDKIDKMNVSMNLTDLPLNNIGITLNNQQIDLMMIASSNDPISLNNVLKKITNIRVSLNTLEMTHDEFIKIRQQIFDMYIDSLVDRNEYFMSFDIELKKKIGYLQRSGVLSDEEFLAFQNIVSQNSHDLDAIILEIDNYFGSEKATMIYETMRQYSPIEKDGVKSTSLEAYRNLYEEIRNNFNSITIDDEGKYYGVMLQNGEFDFSHLKKSLDFARTLGKKVRINTLCFYMDCPNDIYMMEKSDDATRIAKDALTKYVEGVCSFIRDNGYEDVVRSIDVFNELLNRYALDGDVPYQYRGDIAQPDRNNPNFDNVASGWQKHLTLDDLCDVISFARKILPNTDFMFNDANLEEPTKIPYFCEMMRQIQSYERRNNVKLVDSIGTQMHVDTNLTKEDIINMFVGLFSLNLPIEITEFDMCLPEKLLSLLSIEEIEGLKQLRINELCTAVGELLENTTINGVTIWSVNDKHNFMIGLVNKMRINNGQAPLETLYGGYFDNNMRSRQNVSKKRLSYNYHTHTNKCGHASVDSETAYVDCARKNGITTLGFSDHIPFTMYEYGEYDQRMTYDETYEYISTINGLKKINPDMNIMCGIEAEYDPLKEQFLGEFRDSVDYMILGQHFVSNVEGVGNPNYPLEYAKMISQAIDSGIFDIIAHPDYFMELRDTMTTEEDRALFLENARVASLIICEKALEYGIPLEFNFKGIDMNNVLSDGELSYPHSLFWDIANQMQVSALYGVDAHDPKKFNSIEFYKEFVQKMGLSRVVFIDDYNPIVARSKNLKLQQVYAKSQENALTYETMFCMDMLSKMFKGIPDESFDVSIFGEVCSRFMQQQKLANIEEASLRDKKLVEATKGISETKQGQEKDFLCGRVNKVMVYNNGVIANRQQLMDFLPNAVNKAIELGAKSKDEIRLLVGQITEAKYSKDANKKESLNNMLMQRQETISSYNVTNKKQSYGPVLKKCLINSGVNNSSSSNKGFMNFLQLTLIVSFVLGIIVGILYMIYMIN